MDCNILDTAFGKGKKLVVLGGGESGAGAALLGKKLGYEVFLSDRGILNDKYKRILMDEKIAFEEGGHSPDKIYAADLAVKSPGIPEDAEPVVNLRKKGIEVISEIEFAGRHSRAKMCCITGSNGKTTTTLLTHYILTRAGVDAGLAGNVGKSLAAQVAENAHSVYVVELSSFQLDDMFDFRADVAVLTNITPDHLDRYEHKYENYINAKFRILQNMTAENLFIYGWDSPDVTAKIKTIDVVPETAPFTYSADESCAARMDENMLEVRLDGRIFRIDADEISIKGRHNVYNAMCAVLICLRLGLSNEQIADGLRTFPQVEHRLEKFLTCDGVSYINDSKATNVDSAWYALDSMKTPVVWIAGGKDKGNDYSVLFDLVGRKVKALVCMGVDNQKLIDNFKSMCKIADTHSLEEAVRAARTFAEPGDTVLLSPCCASFDLFKSYEHRGEMFKQEVRKQCLGKNMENQAAI